MQHDIDRAASGDLKVEANSVADGRPLLMGQVAASVTGALCARFLGLCLCGRLKITDCGCRDQAGKGHHRGNGASRCGDTAGQPRHDPEE